MKGLLVLTGHSLKRVRTLVLGMGAILAGFQILLNVVAASLHRSKAFVQLYSVFPEFVRQLLGPSFVAMMSFSGVVCLGYFHIAVLGALLALTIALAGEPAAEIETGFIDLLLSRPLGRLAIMARSVIVVTLSTTLVLAMMTFGTGVGLHWIAPKDAPWPSSHLIHSLALHLGALLWCWGGITLALSSLSRRRSVAGSLAGGLALSLFLLDLLGRLWKPAERLAWLSPFRYYSPLDIVVGRPAPAHHLWVLLGIAFTGFLLAFIFYSRRNI